MSKYSVNVLIKSSGPKDFVGEVIAPSGKTATFKAVSSWTELSKLLGGLGVTIGAFKNRDWKTKGGLSYTTFSAGVTSTAKIWNIFSEEDKVASNSNGVTVAKLMKLCQDEIKRGNGNKIVLLSDDDELNGFHTLFEGFISSPKVVEQTLQWSGNHDRLAAKDVVLLV